MPIRLTRRSLLGSVAALGVVGPQNVFAAEGPPEIVAVRVLRDTTCGAPITIAGPLLANEGFTEVQYNDFQPGLTDVQHVVNGFADIAVAFAPDVVRELDAGTQILTLGGLHVGCQELFVREPIASIKDLRGRRVAVSHLGWGTHLTLSVIISAIGLDPARDIEWVGPRTARQDAPGPRQMFESGEVDAYLALPPHAQELRARGLGKLILRTSTDLPWSQYFCCMLVARREYVENYPVATKRLLRAILKSTDFCASDPDTAASMLGERAPEVGVEIARQIIADVPYDVWRDYDPEDTLRFFALRLNELQFIKSTPGDLLASGTDWQFLNELKRELKT
jgi:NitT/TauT family transport system substrate-binding protein